MHLTIEQQLAVRDSEADSAAAAHNEGCDRCRAEVDSLIGVRRTLADLPEIGPQRNLWPEIERAAKPHAGSRRRLLAAAAAAVVVVGGGIVAYQTTSDSTGTNPAGTTIDNGAVIAELVAASRELEGLLSRPALKSRVMKPRQAAVIVTLEDRIADIDALLSASTQSTPEAEAVALWSHRVRLLAALVQMRGAPASTPIFQKAVNTEGSGT